MKSLLVVVVFIALATLVAGQAGGQAGCSSAYDVTTPLNPTPFTVLSNNEDAQVFSPNPCSTIAPSTSGSVWYTLTPTAGAVVTLSTCEPGTNFDTTISIFTGGCSGLECVSASDSSTCQATSTHAEIKFLAQGGKYYIAVGGSNNAKGSFQLAFSESAVLPVGCYEAITIPGPFVNDPVYVVASTANMGGLPPSAPACGSLSSLSHIAWYSVTLTPGLAATVSTCNVGTNFDTILAIYSGPDCLNLACVTSNDDYSCSVGSSSSSTVQFSVNTTTPYHIAVSGYNSAYGDFELSIIQRLGNIGCRKAPTFAVSNGASISGSTSPTGIVTEEDPCSSAAPGSPAAYYELSFTAFTEVTLTTCNSGTNFDTKLLVWSGDCGAPTCVAYDDDSSCTFSSLYSTVTFTPVSGTKYFVVVTGYSTSYYGDYVLSASQ